MEKDITRVVGLDVGDRFSHYCILGAEGEVEEEGRLATTAEALKKRFGCPERMRIVLETGTHSPWMARLLERLGHEVIVANARKLAMIYRSDNKTDRVDAEMLARVGRMDVRLLAPVAVKSEEQQAALALVRSRGQLVGMRTKLVNHVRGSCKSFGVKLPKVVAAGFHRKVRELVPGELRPALEPVLAQLESLEPVIEGYDRLIEEAGEGVWKEETRVLRSVPGVGHLTALTYLLTVGDPGRFRHSRMVGAYLGLKPKRDQSGEKDKPLRITRTGDPYLRSLLVGSAQLILGRFGPECALRQWGLKLASRGGGKIAKKRAVVAVARKLAVLLHRLWVTGEEFQPFPQGTKVEAAG